MSIGFGISEGVKGVFKARLAITLSISSISFSVLLVGIFLVAALNLNTWVGFLREKIEIELFVETGTTSAEIEALKSSVIKVEGVDSIQYISKAEAAERFQKEFGQDVMEVLEYNPFPPSIIIRLAENYRTPEAIIKIKNRLELLPGVDEVFYKKPLLQKINQYVNIIYILSLVIGIIVIVIAFGLIFNTIRLTIYARKEMIHIMRLVGATEGFIRQPFIVEGVIQGGIGAVIASVIIFYGIKIIQSNIYPYIAYHPFIFAALVMFGMFIGLLSASMSVRKYLKII